MSGFEDEKFDRPFAPPLKSNQKYPILQEYLAFDFTWQGWRLADRIFRVEDYSGESLNKLRELLGEELS